MSKTLLVLSGIPPSHWGTGRLVSHLQEEIRSRGLACVLLSRPARPALRCRPFVLTAYRYLEFRIAHMAYRWRLARALRDNRRPLLILHPQTLGFETTLGILESRRAPAALFMLDSSFFCIASYNHIAGEHVACTRCLGGDFSRAEAMGCAPFPKPDAAARRFVEELRKHVAAGHVALIAQTATQAALARAHFSLSEEPPVVGLWTSDWNAVLSRAKGHGNEAPAACWDVVFHGFDLPAKGSTWLEAVAARLPAYRFLFPFARPLNRDTPHNCEYKAMTWESGLEQAVRSAPLSVVPSLWSAPIEGALVKSIGASPGTAVVSNASAYASELPEGIVLRLPAEPEAAAQALEKALQSHWRAEATRKADWLDKLARQRDRFIERLLEAVPGDTLRNATPNE